MNLFASGYMPLEQRSKAESLYWAICRKVGRLLRQLDYIPEELQPTVWSESRRLVITR